MPILSFPLKFSRFIACIVMLGCIGCGSSDSDIVDMDSCVSLVEPAESTEVVTLHSGPALWNSGEGWEIMEEMRLGSGKEENPILFGRIRSMDIDSDGYLYILDSTTQEIYVFDDQGVHVRTVGSIGAGPGEFENAVSVDVSESGEIWVMEMQAGKLTIFDSDGNYLRTEQVNTAGWIILPYPGGFDAIGRYNAVVLCYDNHEQETKRMLARFDQTFSPLDTIAIPNVPLTYEDFTHITDNGGSLSMAIPFQASSRWGFSSDGHFWTLVTDPYELTKVSAGGQAIRRITKDVDKIKVTDSELQQVIENHQWFIDQGGRIDADRIPRHKPAIDSFFSDDEGNLWVKRSESRPDQIESHFDIFNSDGDYLGEVQMPFKIESTYLSKIQNGLLYSMILDEEGAQVIVRARILK